MDDLISRQALREAMYHEAFETDSNMQRWDSGCWIRYKMFENAIESAPTIDPVKHGRWIRKSPTAWMWTCSCCKKDDVYAYSAGESFEPDVLQDLFCPNCGARMNDDWEEPEINPCRGCDDYDWHGGCKSHGGCGVERSDE